MKFRKLRIALLRRSLEKSGFYEDIIFENKAVSKAAKENLAIWIFNLQEYRNIEIEKFEDFFKGLSKIVFPIKIKEAHGIYSFDIKFIDAQENKYYMSKRNVYDYHSIEEYVIVRRDTLLEPLFEIDFHYQILKDKSIMLMEKEVMQINQDGTNKDTVVNFSYDSDENTTEATLLSYVSNNKIKIKYPTLNAEFDNMVMNYLFESNESKWYYYDVFPILKRMVESISDEKVSIFVVAEIEQEIFSKIEVVNGIVQKYTVTQIINEGEICIIKKIVAKELREFLAEKS